MSCRWEVSHITIDLFVHRINNVIVILQPLRGHSMFDCTQRLKYTPLNSEPCRPTDLFQLLSFASYTLDTYSKSIDIIFICFTKLLLHGAISSPKPIHHSAQTDLVGLVCPIVGLVTHVSGSDHIISISSQLFLPLCQAKVTSGFLNYTWSHFMLTAIFQL